MVHKEMAVTRPAWIRAALEGKARVESSAKVSLGRGSVVPGTRYRIIRWLGEGGMGVVYEAEHVDLGRKAALKVLLPDLCRNPEALRMFREEARAASQLGDEFIVDVFDFAELPDGRLLFAMELLEGHSLAHEIEGARLEPSRAIAILRQICKGLAVAHGAGIIHRDVKPDNVALSTRRGRKDAVKILDFGIATIMGEHGDGPISAGSPYYLAPELVTGLSFDLRVDVYAVGCTAHEMLTGFPPLDGDTVEEVLRAHLERAPPHASALAPDVPAALDAVIQRCLAKDPADRYRDMVELEAALCEAQIEAGLHTAWDDLPVPQIDDPDRRERILRAMPDPASGLILSRSGNRWALAAAALAVVLGGTALMRSLRGEAAAAAASQVAQLEQQARAEAARHYYVYPPVDDPTRATAYTVVRAIEDLDEGEDAGTKLRTEFARTLVRLGDSYWEREGGKAFAIDYYAQALVFEPKNQRARERGTLTPGQLAALEQKAVEGDFTANELAAVEPLVVLASDNPEDVVAGLERLSDRGGVLASTTEASLEKLAGRRLRRRSPKTSGASVIPPPAGFASTPARTEPANPQGSIELVNAAGSGTGSVPPPGPEKPGRDRAQAAALVAKGQAALGAGDRNGAIRHFERAVARDRKSGAALVGLSDAYFSKGNYPQAVRFAEKATRVSPRQARYHLTLGDAYYKVLRYTDAARAYQRAKVLGNSTAQRRLDRVAAKLE